MTEASALGLGPGDVIQDTYEILGVLGRGGMGATFRGRNRATGHEVAIKVISPELASDQRFEELFKRESNLLRTIRHDGVIRYETTLQDRKRRLYLVMEYVQGKPLAAYLRRRARLSSEDVLDLGAKLAGGLAAVHQLNIVHRDVSPDNILIPDDNTLSPKLIDFGVASDTVGTDRSIIGESFAGKLTYAAPEQLGLFGGRVAPATDVYALGLVLLRVAGGQIPGEGKGIADMLEARREDVSLAGASLSPALTLVLEAMLRADPADRPTDLPALFASADAGAEPQPPEPDRSNPDAAPPLRMHRAAIAAGLAALIVVAAAGTWLMIRPGGDLATPPQDDAAIADRILASKEPMALAESWMTGGGQERLNGIYAAMLTLARDEARPTDLRQSAAMAAAKMYDPVTFDATRSPFREPNPTAALRHYCRAADLGSSDATEAVTRLGGCP